MFFEVEDFRPDTPSLPRALTTLESVLLTFVAYLLIVIVYIVTPARWFQQTFVPVDLPPQQNETFVSIVPRLDKIAPPKPQAPPSDLDRRATNPAPAPKPENPMPKAQGNTDQQLMGTPEERAKGPESTAPPSPATRPVTPLMDPTLQPSQAASGGLGSALHNLNKYLQDQSFNNPQGGAQDIDQGDIQFDSKGVDFGPWIRRFIATVRHNWNVPLLAQSLSGHVVITFNVHKDGRITEITVIKPSSIDSFNISAKNALLTSNPTMPIPKDYPADPCFFTVTFYYNERPPIK